MLKTPKQSDLAGSINQKASNHPSNLRRGFTLGFTAYAIWGSFPLLVSFVGAVNPLEIVAWRIVFGFALSILLVSVTRSWQRLFSVLRDARQRKWVILATVFIFSNWVAYVIGVATHHIVETALGYFINPLVTIVLAVVFLGERLRLVQWVAVGFGLVAVIVLTIDYGQLPLIALTLAASFGIYGLAKSKLGGLVSPLHGFALESGLLLPVAAAMLFGVASVDGTLGFATHGTTTTWVLVGFGFLTAVPLILFGAAANHLPLRVIGFMQYSTPTIQFLLALVYFHEPMPAVRWVGFALVWSALAILTFDILRNQRQAPVGAN